MQLFVLLSRGKEEEEAGGIPHLIILALRPTSPLEVELRQICHWLRDERHHDCECAQRYKLSFCWSGHFVYWQWALFRRLKSNLE